MINGILLAAKVKNAPGNGEINLPQIEPEKVVTGGFNTAFFIAGALAVIMIIVSGIMYMTAGGDAKKAALAAKSIMVTIIGLIVIVLAYAIVNFVIGNIG